MEILQTYPLGDEYSKPVFTKCRHGLRQSLSFQRIQVLVDRLCRILEAQPVIPCRPGHDTWRQIQQVQNEFVGMLRFNAIRRDPPREENRGG